MFVAFDVEKQRRICRNFSENIKVKLFRNNYFAKYFVIIVRLVRLSGLLT